MIKLLPKVAAKRWDEAIGRDSASFGLVLQRPPEEPGKLDEDQGLRLLRASVDALLDPHVLLEAVRDSVGRVVDFRFRELNEARCSYVGLSRDDLLGRGLAEISPGVVQTDLFPACVRCLDTGEPVVIDDYFYGGAIRADSPRHDTRRYDIRATRATPTAIIATWRDVSERYETARALEETRDLLRASSDALLDPHVFFEAVWDSRGNVVDFIYREINQATCDYVGMSREALRGSRLLDNWPGIADSGLLAEYVRCLDTGQPLVLDDFSYANEVLRDTRRYDIRATRATPTAIVVTWRDVTERFLMARDLAEARDRLRASSEALLDPYVLLEAVRDPTGRVIDFAYREINQATCEAVGLPREQILGHGLLEHWPGIIEAGLFDAYVRCLSSGEPVVMDDFEYHNDVLDETRRYDLRASRASANSLTLTWRDVNDRFEAARLLAQARELRHKADLRYRRLVDNSAIGMCLVSPEGRFETVNPALSEFFGHDAATLREKTWQELTDPEYLDADLQNVTEVLAGRLDAYQMDKKFIHADGHPIWGHISVSCIRTRSGAVENFISQIIDITEAVESRRKLAERDEQNRQLAQRLQAQTDLLTAGLRSAAAYVSSILPGDLHGPVRVSSRYLPSEELAGDIYDYRWVDHDHLVVYLIDVSGHGIGPALLSVSVHNMLRTGAVFQMAQLAPAQVLSELNRRFPMDQQGGNYLTMWCGIYELSSRTLRYASAGAPPAIAVGGSASTVLPAEGRPIGLFADSTYATRTYIVPPGCRILLFSDGVYEDAFDDGSQLPLEDLRDVFTAMAESSLDDFVAELGRRRPSGAFEDDCSLVRLEFD